jgi:precorrin-6A/cobalt-precorrin-6A reductase
VTAPEGSPPLAVLFGGTSETAPLAEAVLGAGWRLLVSTATATPLSLAAHPRLARRRGRLERAGLERLLAARAPAAVIDAAHPYAVELHRALHAAAAAAQVPLIRFVRPAAAPPPGTEVRPAADHAEAARLAAATGGPVLLTTGVKDLSVYVAEAGARGTELWARVLPGADSHRAARAAGLPPERILSGRGPFTVEENRRALQAAGARALVTKESGPAGGVGEKYAAAAAAGVPVILVRRPALPPARCVASAAELLAALPARPARSE